MHTHVSVKTAYTLFIFSILTIVLVQILEGLYSDIASGGNGWRQGDWLINNEHQLVRRGIFASLIFGVSDYFSISPLTLLGIIQGVILVFTFSVVIVFIARLGANTRILWLVLSPVFVLMFWFLYFGNTFRKEILVYFYFAILMIDIIINSKRSIIIWISSFFSFFLSFHMKEIFSLCHFF